MQVFLMLASLVCATRAVSFFDLIAEEWQLFKLEHKKSYPSETEEKFRMKIFMDNKHKIARHNAKFQKGETSYELGLNKYADMLHHEFIHTMNGFNRTGTGHLKLGRGKEQVSLRGATFIPPANVKLPDYVNWVEQGAVTPVKDQGQCGSCWSFSATGALEGQTFRKTGFLVSLSEQNLIDCSTDYGNQGCSGGLMDNAFKYIRDNGGIDTERSYPYEGEDDDKCRYKSKNSGATDVGFIDIPSGDEDKLKAAVATVGPVSIAIDASHESFQFYKKGVYSDTQCSSEKLDHGVLVVGYGTDDVTGQDYWLVKNSWSESWGDKGYIKIARNMDNLCGVATAASYPLV